MLGRPIIGSSGSLGLPTDPLTLNGDVKRKRGRPRTLDGPQDDNACFGPSRVNTVHSSSTSLPTSLLRWKQIRRLQSCDTSHCSQSLTSGVSLVNSQALSFNAAVAKLNKAALTSQAMSPLQAALNRSNRSKPNIFPSTHPHHHPPQLGQEKRRKVTLRFDSMQPMPTSQISNSGTLLVHIFDSLILKLAEKHVIAALPLPLF